MTELIDPSGARCCVCHQVPLPDIPLKHKFKPSSRALLCCMCSQRRLFLHHLLPSQDSTSVLASRSAGPSPE